MALSDIVLLSLQVSLSAVSLVCLVGLPLGAALAHLRFPDPIGPDRRPQRADGFAPVVAGLAIYLLLSNAGPLGPLGLLYTPSAMIIAQVVLVMPDRRCVVSTDPGRLTRRIRGAISFVGPGADQHPLDTIVGGGWRC